MEKIVGFNIYKNWYSKFPLSEVSTDTCTKMILMLEPRINKLAKTMNLKNLKILELGCLEGAHSFMLQMLGAREIIAIEGRVENFLKCLIVKNAYNLNKCKFLYGDMNEILFTLSIHVDICLALGVLYHLHNPISLIHRIATISDNLFAWTHYSTKDYPEGPLVDIRYQNHVYRGKYVREDTDHFLSGLDKVSFWIFEDDILSVIQEAGFKKVDLVEKEKHNHGPAITFLAQK